MIHPRLSKISSTPYNSAGISHDGKIYMWGSSMSPVLSHLPKNITLNEPFEIDLTKVNPELTLNQNNKNVPGSKWGTVLAS